MCFCANINDNKIVYAFSALMGENVHHCSILQIQSSQSNVQINI